MEISTGTLTVVVTTFNEKSNIERALSSVSWADNIIVVDGCSTDNTIEIASSYTKNIIRTPNKKQLNINKNIGFSVANTEWILSLDADEEVSRDLADEIRFAISQQNELVAYRIPRKNYMFGKWMQHGDLYPDYQTRLFMNGYGWFECIHIHEFLMVKGNTGIMYQPLMHYTYPSLSTYFRKFNKYTSFEAKSIAHSKKKIFLDISDQHDLQQQNTSSNKRLRDHKIIAKIAADYIITKPITKFLNQFIRKQGYLDGWQGGIIAFFSAIYYQVSFAKYLYLLFIDHLIDHQ